MTDGGPRHNGWDEGAFVAAILAIIDGRADNDGLAVVTTEDWQLAETMFATSLQIVQSARDHKQRKADERREYVRANKVADALAINTALSAADAERLERVVSLSGHSRWASRCCPWRWTGRAVSPIGAPELWAVRRSMPGAGYARPTLAAVDRRSC